MVVVLVDDDAGLATTAVVVPDDVGEATAAGVDEGVRDAADDEAAELEGVGVAEGETVGPVADGETEAPVADGDAATETDDDEPDEDA